MKDEVLNVIGEVVRETLGAAMVVEVREWRTDLMAEPDDELVRIEVIYEDGPLDPGKTVSLTRLARSRLSEIGSAAFPIFSFISRVDDESERPAAA